MKKNFLHPSFHKAFVSLEILLAIVVMGVGFGVFWKIYSINSGSRSAYPSELFSLQKSLYQKISPEGMDLAQPFSLRSQKGFYYQGKMIEEGSKEGVRFFYFYPESVQSNASF